MSTRAKHAAIHPQRALRSRREFMSAALSLAAWAASEQAQAQGSGGSPGPELDPRTAQVLATTATVDLHTHYGRVSRDPAAPPGDLAGAMRRGRLGCVCLAHVPDGSILKRGAGGVQEPTHLPAPGELYAPHLAWLDWVDRLIESQGFKRVLSPADLQAAHAAGQPALLQDIEGCDFVEGRLERVEAVYRRGVRKLQLVHYTPNDVGDFQTGQPRHGGLTALGAQVIRECHRLRMVVDVAHGTLELVKGALKVATQPLLLSHTALSGSQAQGPTPLAERQVTPEHARLVAQTGGIVGIWHQFKTPQLYAEGIREMVDVIGVDSVGIGSDVVPGGSAFALSDYGRYPEVISGLLKLGFTPQEVGKIAGGNFMRVFKQIAAA